MKKLLIAMVALAMVTATSFGMLSVMWNTGAFLSYTGDSAGVLADADTDYVLWELVWTSSSTVADPTLNTVTGAISYNGGADEVVSSRVITTDGNCSVSDIWKSNMESADMTMEPWCEVISGGPAAYNGTPKESLPHDSGNLYSMVFQYLTDGSVYFAKTDLVTPNFDSDGKVMDKVNFDLGGDTAIDTYLGQIIPEPATMGLLGLGSLAMVLRRKLRK